MKKTPRTTPPRIVFALERVLGHASLAQSVQRFAGEGDAARCSFVDVTFHRPGGLVERMPLPAYLRAALRARLEVRAVLGAGLPDAFLFNTQKAAHMCPDYVRARPSLLSLDVTPAQYDAMGSVYGHAADKGIVRAAKHAWNRRLFRGAARLVPWSRWAAGSLMRDYRVPADRITVIPPGADTERWRPGPRRDDGAVRLLFIGGNFDRKGGRLLLEWFQRSDDARRCELHLVTRDAVSPASNVVVHRLENNSDELIALAQSCDIFVLPTLADCFSIASVEAMAAGLPVVVSDIGGIGDIVADGENGFLVPPRDREALAAALRPLVHDGAMRWRMGAAGRRCAEQRFDARTNVRRLLDETLRAIDERAGAAREPLTDSDPGLDLGSTSAAYAAAHRSTGPYGRLPEEP
jgi:glycosyltransferase involved in cell wall biosynthesis